MCYAEVIKSEIKVNLSYENTAERLLKDAQENKENAIEEAKKIHENSLRKVEEEKKQCDELAAQKSAMVESLKKLTEDTARLMEKMRG